MPTAARLAGAVIFALYGWYIAGISTIFFPEESAPGLWIPAGALIGLFIGWRICGRNAGHGYNPAVSIGLTCAAVFSFTMLFVVAFEQMITNAMNLRYGGPMEAVVDVFAQMLLIGAYFGDVVLIATILIGGIICAWIVEFFGQRYS